MLRLNMEEHRKGLTLLMISIIVRTHLYLKYDSPKTLTEICRHLDSKKYNKVPNFAHKILKELVEIGILEEIGTIRNMSNNILIPTYQLSIKKSEKYIDDIKHIRMSYGYFRDRILSKSFFSAVEPEPYSKEQVEQIIKEFGGRK